MKVRSAVPVCLLFLLAVPAADLMADGYVDVEKVRPFTLTMPDNRYWAVGEQVGRAWHDGKALREKK